MICWDVTGFIDDTLWETLPENYGTSPCYLAGKTAYFYGHVQYLCNKLPGNGDLGFGSGLEATVYISPS